MSEITRDFWTGISAGFTVIVGLVAIIYKRVTDDIKDHDESLDEGVKSFEEIHQQLIIERGRVAALELKVAELEKEKSKLHDTVLKLVTHHNRNHQGSEVV